MRIEKKGMNKKAVSLMVSYVLLISIAIALSIGVFIWLKGISNVTPVADCKEGTSILLENYTCTTGITGGISLEIKNSGYFNISGIVLSVSDNVDRFPITYLTKDIFSCQSVGQASHCQFNSPLKPGDKMTATYTNIDAQTNSPVTFTDVEVVRIQAFIIDTTGKVICENSAIKQNVQSCTIK
jgi:hypothetical protein